MTLRKRPVESLEPEESEEAEEGPEAETDYLMEREIQRQKIRAAHIDIVTVKQNTDTALKLVEQQQTAVLDAIGTTETEIENEMSQYWLKELPFKQTINNYVKNVASLINVYEQHSRIVNTALVQILESVEFPDFQRIEETYIAEIKDMEAQMNFMKEEVTKIKTDLEAEFEDTVSKKVLEERNKLHDEYSEIMNHAEKVIDEMDKVIVEKTGESFFKKHPEYASLGKIPEKTDTKKAVLEGDDRPVKPFKTKKSKLEFIEPDEKPLGIRRND